MAKTFKPVVIAANDLLEGDSIYLGPDGWVRDIALARVGDSPDAAEALLAESEGVIEVVGPYAVEVSLETGAPWPVARREQIKASRETTIPVGPEAETRVAA